jgi:hypothetical protein
MPHLAWVIHLAAIILWVVVSEVKFSDKGECDNEDQDQDEQADVCATTGPYIAFV